MSLKIKIHHIERKDTVSMMFKNELKSFQNLYQFT